MTATTTKTTLPSSLLERTLRANVVFSTLSGGILLLGSPWLSAVLGPPGWIVALVGAGVIGFGGFLVIGLRRDVVTTGRVAFVADLGWVVATIGLAPFAADSFTTLGAWTAIAVAVVVGDLALFEWIGLRRSAA